MLSFCDCDALVVEVVKDGAACHTGTEQGFFDDDHLQRPAGLSARQSRAWND